MFSDSLKIIFVRHGSTAANEARIHQKPEEPLSKEGIRQVKRVADRLKDANADMIISSKCKRAVQTAQAISKATGKRVIYTSLLNEVVNPSKFHGKKYGAMSVAQIVEEIQVHASDPKWHHSDEENQFDRRDRAIKAIAYLRSKKADTLIVVTHSLFMRMILFVGIFGEDADVVHLFRKFKENIGAHNAAITECEIDKGYFRLITYNDRAHLL